MHHQLLLAVSIITLGAPLEGLAEAAQSSALPPAGLDRSEWAQINELIKEQERSFLLEDGTYRARHRGLGLIADIGREGSRISPRGGEWDFGLALRAYGFSGLMAPAGSSARWMRADGQRLSLGWSETVQEWWINQSDGFEHGFDVLERPEGPAEGAGPLVFELEVLGALTPAAKASRKGVALFDDRGEAAIHYDGLFCVDACGVELESWIELEGRTLRIFVDETDAQYPIVIDPVVQDAYLKASNTSSNDDEQNGEFGYSVDIWAATLVVGAPGEESAATGVNGDQSDQSAPDAGAVYVFFRTAGVWSQQAYLKASNAEAGDRFGQSVCIDGDTIVVGAPFEDSASSGVNGSGADNSLLGAGAAYVFERVAGTWIEEAYLKPVTPGGADQFGWDVSIDNNDIVVGAPGEDSAATGVNGDATSDGATESGAAYVFRRSGGVWSQTAYLKASNTEAGDRFGSDVGIDGSRLAVGAPFEDSAASGLDGDQLSNALPRSGAAYGFQRVGADWTQEVYLKASNPDADDNFGSAVGLGGASMSGTVLVVGAPFEDSSATETDGDGNDNSATNSGAAYAFRRNGATWTFESYLKASEVSTGLGLKFGNAVAVDGDLAVIGAFDAGAITSPAPFSGAAFVLARAGGTWQELDVLKASNAESTDAFGHAVAINGNTVVVGAFQEDSAATGVNGDELDNSAPGAGAAYTFNGALIASLGLAVCPGAPNSTGAPGVTDAIGSPAVADNFLVLEVSGCPPGQFGLVATSPASGGPIQTVAVGQGQLCIANPQIGRFPVVVTDAAGSAAQWVDLDAVPTALGLRPVQPGETFYFQFWHRDSVGGMGTSNLTGAVSVLFE